MKIFISFSGEKSKHVALTLKTWIHNVIQAVDPWTSETDIQAGARWGAEVAGVLQQAKFGIICLTKENANEPWILFEAGALAKTLEQTFVCPYLIDMEPTDIPRGSPLNQFKAKRSNEAETLHLMRSINLAVAAEGENAISDEQLVKTVGMFWGELNNALRNLPPDSNQPPGRKSNEMIPEILEIVRDIARTRTAGERQRRLGPKAWQRGLTTLGSIMEGTKGTAEIIYQKDDPEAYTFASDVYKILLSAGWEANPPKPFVASGDIPAAIEHGAHDTAVTIRANFKDLRTLQPDSAYSTLQAFFLANDLPPAGSIDESLPFGSCRIVIGPLW
jgi:hypothetical protein